ncbi:F-box protein CPR1-like [Rhodamnia argentea]|uniref:F-box protein CPR1-like n=1 Tax=Rhodamnia argentea TaxID=178133 RepID=A0ABM3GUL5_9MYRT|nr:F-box protein CPR1-like [Rhodamnia argentea]
MAGRSSDDPKLPHDVVVEILKRLPAESLLRFRCVSRSWRSTIDDPRFVALHLNHSALDASNRYLVCLEWRHRLCFLLPNESLTLPFQSLIEIPFVNPSNCYGFVVSSNGLIWVAEILSNGCCQTMYLWNLFTRKHKVVRGSCPEHQFFSKETAHVVLGFCFDVRSNDYKIVRIIYFPDDNRRYFGGSTLVEIYSLSTDSWRSLECEVPSFSGYRRAVFLNGNLHWFAFKFEDLLELGGYGAIVLFDVAGEVFDEMALPAEMLPEDDFGLIASVEVLNDLLAVFISHGEQIGYLELHSNCSVWVMRHYGVPESWTKMYTFEASGLLRVCGGFTWTGELLIEIDSGKRVSWNPITGQFTNLPSWMTSDLVTVVESLVSL